MKSVFEGDGHGASLRVDTRREFRPDRSWGYPILVSGWAAELVIMSDGRRQVTGLFLPGERLIASPLSHQSEGAGLLAITPIEIRAVGHASVDEELALLRTEIERHLARGFRAAVRLGCLTAYEKTANLLLEIVERAGPPRDGSIDFPLTQELLADLLGLSQVHVNRTLQQLRRDGLIELQGGRLTILQRARLQTAGHYASLFDGQD